MSFFVSKDIEGLINKESLVDDYQKHNLYLSADNLSFFVSAIKFKKKKKITITLSTTKYANYFLKDNLAFKLIINKCQYKITFIKLKSITQLEDKLLVKLNAIIEE